MCCEQREALRSITVLEGWLLVENLSYTYDVGRYRALCVPNGEYQSGNGYEPLTGTPTLCVSSGSWKPRYCMFVCELRKLFFFDNERQKRHTLERLRRALRPRTHMHAAMSDPQYEHLRERPGAADPSLRCSRRRLDGGIERFASRWSIALWLLTEYLDDREKIAFGDVLSRGVSELSTSSSVSSPTKSRTLAADSRNRGDSSSKLSSRLTAARRSLPHKFKQQTRTATDGEERARTSRRTSFHNASDAPSATSGSAERLDAPDVPNRVRQSSGQQAGLRHYLEQVKQSLSVGKLNRKPETDAASSAGSCNELDRSGDELSRPRTNVAPNNASKRASLPRSTASASTPRQMREFEREFGPLVENDVRPPDDAESRPHRSVVASQSDPFFARGDAYRVERCSSGSTVSSSAASTCTGSCCTESPFAAAFDMQCAGATHPSVVPVDYTFAFQVYADSYFSNQFEYIDADTSDTRSAEPSPSPRPSNDVTRRCLYLAAQTREEQRSWLAALRGAPPSPTLRPADTTDSSRRRADHDHYYCCGSFGAARGGTDLTDAATSTSAHSVRTERLLKLAVTELRNVPTKKRYFCEVYLDSLLYARTAARASDEGVLFCELFEFCGLPPYAFVHVAVFREASGAAKRKNRLVAALTGSRSHTLLGRCSVDLPRLLTARPNSDLEAWYPLVMDDATDAPASISTRPSGKKCAAELRVKVRYLSLDILPRDHYAELVQLVRNDYVQLVALLEPIVPVRFKEDFAVALVGVMHYLRHAQRFLVDVVVHDVRSLNDAQMTFRGNSIATKATEAYLKLVGEQYLHETLGGFIKELLESGDDCEVDEQKTQTLAENRKRLEKWCTNVCERIGRSHARIPPELQGVLSELRRELAALGKSALVENLISSCVFLRFLCPAILSPSLFGLTAEYPSQTMNRNLTLITKVVQTLANDTEFGAKEAYMLCMNSFLADHRTLLRDFVRLVSSGPQPASSSRSPTDAFDEAIDFEKELATVHILLSDTLDSLDERCLRRLDENSTQRNLLDHTRQVVSRISDSLREMRSPKRHAKPHGNSTATQPIHTSTPTSNSSSSSVAQLAANSGHITAIAGLQQRELREQRVRSATTLGTSVSSPANANSSAASNLRRSRETPLARSMRANPESQARPANHAEQSPASRRYQLKATQSTNVHDRTMRHSVYDNVSQPTASSQRKISLNINATPTSTQRPTNAQPQPQPQLQQQQQSHVPQPQPQPQPQSREVENNWRHIVREAEAAAAGHPQQTAPASELRLHRNHQSANDLHKHFGPADQSFAVAVEFDLGPSDSAPPPAALQRRCSDESTALSPGGRLHSAKSMPSVQLLENAERHEFEFPLRRHPESDITARPSNSSSEMLLERSTPASEIPLQLHIPAQSVRNNEERTRHSIVVDSQFSTLTSGYQSWRSNYSDSQASAASALDPAAVRTRASSAMQPSPIPPASSLDSRGRAHSNTQAPNLLAGVLRQPTAAPARSSPGGSQHMPRSNNSPHSLHTPSVARGFAPSLGLVSIASPGDSAPNRNSATPAVRRTAAPTASASSNSSPLHTSTTGVQRSQIDASANGARPVASHNGTPQNNNYGVMGTRPLNVFQNTSAGHQPAVGNIRQSAARSSFGRLPAAFSRAPPNALGGRSAQLGVLAKQLEDTRAQVERLQSTDMTTCRLLADWNARTNEVLRLVSRQQLERRDETAALTQQLNMFEQTVRNLAQPLNTDTVGSAQQSTNSTHQPARTPSRPQTIDRGLNEQTAVQRAATATQAPAAAADPNSIRALRDSVESTLAQIRMLLRDDALETR